MTQLAQFPVGQERRFTLASTPYLEDLIYFEKCLSSCLTQMVLIIFAIFSSDHGSYPLRFGNYLDSIFHPCFVLIYHHAV